VTFAKCQASAQTVGVPARNKKEQRGKNEQNSAYSSLEAEEFFFGRGRILLRNKNSKDK
jgi:hypothetical protein